MQPIKATIKPGDSGPAVSALQDAMLALLAHQIIKVLAPPNRPTKEELAQLTVALNTDRAVPQPGTAIWMLVGYLQVQQGLGDNLHGVVEQKTADTINQLLKSIGVLDDEIDPALVVHGTVAGAQPGWVAQVVDVDFRSVQHLGDALIGPAGDYRVSYHAGDVQAGESGTADIRVTVVDAKGTAVVSSDIHYNVAGDVTIDLFVEPAPDGLSEFERYSDALAPVLGDVPIAEVDAEPAGQQAQDLDFLSGDTGIDRQRIAWLARGAALATGATAAIPAAAFYGWFREGLADDLAALEALPISALRSALRAAITANIAPASLGDEVESILRSMPNPQRDAVQALGTASGLPASKIPTLLQHVSTLTELTNGVTKRLVSDGVLVPAEAHTLGLSVTLHTLFDGRLDAVTAVQKAGAARVPGGALSQARDLAALDAADISAALAKGRVKPADGSTLDAMAARVARALASAYPTDWLLYRAADAKVTDLHSRNPTLDLLAIDYLPGSESLTTVDFGTLSAGDQAKVIGTLKSYQRVQRLTGDAIVSQAVVAAGYHSAVSIVRADPAQFAAATKLPTAQATATYAAARQKANEAAISFVSVHDAARDQKRFSNQVTPGVPATLAKLAGYADLFGSLDYCECEDCQSVLSPAAYFVDLMRYTEKNILGPSFANNGGAGNSLHLKARRPDLWSLPLTCANTETYVPTLDIVIRVLETFITKTIPASTLSLYERIAASDASISQPFTWPLERVTILLSYFGVTRADIARLFVLGTGPADSAKRSQCRLNLSLAEYQQIIAGRLGTPPTVATLTAAGKYYDVLIGPLSLTMIVANIETQFANTIPIAWLADGTDLPLDVLRLLVGTDFINGTATDAAHRIVIQRGIGTPGGVQNDTELVLQLTVGRVDRIERFVRLWRHLPWNVIELDYVLMRLMATLPSTVTPTPDRRLDPPMVDGVAQLLDIQARWSLPVDELCALWDAMPAVGLRNDVSLFDRAFNQSVFVKATADLFPQPATRFAFPELAGVAGTTSPHARLLAALQISDADLSALFAGLDPTNAGLLLTADNLALMYRHARLAVLMGLSIADLFQSITLLGTVGSAVTTLAGLGQLLAFHDWRAASGFGLDEMAFIVGSSPSLGTMASPDDLVASIVAAIQGDEPLEMSDTVFTAIGLTEEQSRGVVAANLSQNATDGLPLERTPGSTTYRLRVPWDPDDPGSPLVFAPVASTAMVAAAARAAYDLASAAGPAGFATDLFTALGMTTARSTAVVNANIHVGTDAKPFVAVGTTGRYRVRADVTPDAALQQMLGDATSSAVLQAAATDGLVAQARALLARHHPFRVIVTHAAASLLTDGDRVRAMLALVMPATSALVLQYITAACEALQGGSQAPLVAMLAALGRLAALFKSSVFDPATLGFASAARAVFALPASPTNLTTPLVLGSDSVRRVAMYVALANAPDPAFDPAAAPADVVALQAILQSGAALSAADPAALAGALRADSPRVGALVQQLQAQLAGGLDGLTQLANALALAGKLGASAATLQLTVSDAFADLTRAADGIYGVFRATYPDEDTFDAKIEPFNDQLRGRQRDGLVEFLIHPPLDATGLPGLFADADDLYDYFLIDVQVGGCARTSEIVSAISTVQLYVQRVIMHLEQSDDGTVIASLVDPPLDEWTWRKNYRLWEANRRIFLFPESYIEPGLRDDKTPLFQDLESTLLQTPVADQDVLDAYAEYLHGFDEIARLRIAGVYHDRPTGGDDALYLFGVTPNEPPVYYYRVIRNVESTKPTTFGPWQKVNLQVPARKVSPIVYGGRLYVFWVETSTRAITSFKNGASVFTGYRHTTRTRVSQLRLDGQWTPPQTLKVVDDSGAPADARLTDDALIKALEALEDSNDVVFWGPYDPNHLTPAQRDNFNALMGVNTVAKTTVFSPEFWYRAEWDIRNRISQEPLENYAPEGWLWERPYPSPGAASLRLPSFPDAPWNTGAPSTLMVDFWAAMIRADTDPSTILTTTDAIGVEPVTTGGQNLRMTYTTKAQPVTLPFYYATRQLNDLTLFTGSGLISASNPLIRVPDATELQVVNGNETNVVIDALGDLLLFRSEPASGKPELWRLGTTLAGLLGEKLSTDGIPGLLKTWWQDNALVESGLTVAVLDTTIDAATRVPTDPLTDAGAVVGYYREVFFQIPFLIADYLNSQQNFEGALKWYNYIFDPTARDDPPTSERVRPWRYHEFRTIAATTGYETFRAMLTNQAELDAYKNDPFNPHAIARLRPGAYQKAVVMKYIDNLIDWGDTLFTQFTMESLNEATMLYVMASEILGRRPAEVGPCGDTTAPPATYQLIAPKLDDGTKSDFLLEEFELLSLPDGGQIDDTYVPVLATAGNPQGSTFTVRSLVAGGGGGGAAGDGGAGVGNGTAPPGYGTGLANPTGWNTPGASVWATTGGTPLSTVYGGGTVDGTLPLTITGTGTPSVSVTGDPLEPPVTVPSIGGFTGTINDVHSAGSMGKLDIGYGSEPPIGQGPPQQGFTPPAQAWDLVASRLVFCFPQNQDFLAYWDRVEDRLNKIRNCMDISGVRRQPDLFAPEIDPRLLVRMRAAGLSLDDVLNATSGMVPPYRFQFLIDKAKQHAGLVQSFGGQLLSALEKRNGEELQQLRAVHEQNLLKLRQKAMQLEIDAAEDTLESLQRQQTAVTFRRDHYANLLQTGLSGFERVQQIGTHIASGMHEIEALVQIVSGALHLVPQLGAPTAIVYGGVQLGETAARFGYASQALAEASAAAATSAGIEATFQRRGEEWKLQMDMANQELSQLEKQITAAGIRRDIATEAQTAHNRSIDQSEEIFDLLRDKFSSFGLYTYLSTELQRLNRLAFNAALSVARMAERAYRFERPDEDAATLLTNDYWDAGNAGLLGGDKLVLDLQQLERRYIETNYRMLEVEQSFSLSQIAPSALLALRENGSCTFTVPEWAFDLTYPGHYRRRIKAVRLSIPCVTGPYLNVGATLQLTASRVRQRTDSNAPLVNVPLGSTSAIATSSAQNDAGTFEFSFRDERFMPFESAGAISDWQLDLPAAFRSFDYRTISDVVLRVSYMADQDAGLRARVENVTAPSVAGSLRKQLEVGGMPLLYSLRNDFPDAWRMLVTSAPGTIVPIDLGERQLPALMAGWLRGAPTGRSLSLAPASLAFVTQSSVAGVKPSPTLAAGLGTTTAPTALVIDATAGADGMYHAALSGTAALTATAPTTTLRLRVDAAGNLAPAAGVTGITLDESKVRDVMLLATVRLSP